MELAKNAMRSNIQDMSNKEYDAFIKKMLKEADSDAEAGRIKTMYDKIREEGSRKNNVDREMGSPSYTKAKGGKVPGYAYGTPKGGVKKMSSCRGRKAMGNKD